MRFVRPLDIVVDKNQAVYVTPRKTQFIYPLHVIEQEMRTINNNFDKYRAEELISEAFIITVAIKSKDNSNVKEGGNVVQYSAV